MKDKCGGGIKGKMYVYESVGEFGRKIGSCKLCLMCQEKEKKNTEKRHMKKNGERKEKWEERKIQKQGMCKLWKKK